MFELPQKQVKPRMESEDKKEGTCPKCSAKMTKNFASISGNAKYINWVCEGCGHKETKCLGVLK